MTRLPTPGSDTGAWGQILNDFLSVEHNPDGTLKASGSLATKANDSAVVHNTGNENVAGVKTFSSSPTVPAPSNPTDAATKAYVDSSTSAGAPDATTSNKGIVQLAGDLGGAGTVATAPIISDNAITTSKLNAGAVTGAKIANTTITDANVSATAAIAKSKLAALNIGDSDVNTLSESKITNLTTDLAAKATDANVVHLAGAETITGAKNFTGGLNSNGTAVATTSRQILTSTGLTGGGDLSADRTLSVVNDTTTQRLEVASSGTLQGTRKRLNFIAGSNATVNVADDNTNNKVDVTIGAASGLQALVPTAVKTSAYTAAANDLVVVDASAGNVTVTLPTAPADGTRIAVKLISVSGTNTCTINAGGSDVFNKAGGTATLSASTTNQMFMLQYATATEIWYASDAPSLAALDARYVKDGALIINVKDYGATGNGSTDDTVAVNAAITAAKATTQKATIYFPAGFYILSSTISLYAGMALTGPIGSLAREFTNRAVIRNTTTDMFQLTADTKDVSMTNLTFYGNSTSTTTNWLTAVNQSSGFILQYSTIMNCGFIWFSSVINGRLLGVWFNNNDLNNCSGATLNLAGSDNCVRDNFIDSTLAGNPTAAFLVIFNALSDTIFSGNYITCNPAMALKVSGGGGLVISDNRFNGLAVARSTGSDGSAVYFISANDIVFTGNYLAYNVQNTFSTFDAVVNVYDSSNITSTDNMFDQQPAGAKMWHIGQTSGTTDSIKIKGSIYRSPAVSKLTTSGTVTNLTWDEWQGKYKTGAGARIADTDYPGTPPDGTTGVVYDTTAVATYYASRSNGSWNHYQVTGSGAVPQTAYMIVASDIPANNTITYADATGLSWSVSSGQVWMVTGQLVYDAATTPNGRIKFQFVVPTSTTWYGTIDGLIATSGAGATSSNVVRTALGSSTATGGTQLGAPGVGTAVSALVTGWFNVTTSGTIKIQFAQATADSINTTTLHANSFLYATRLA